MSSLPIKTGIDEPESIDFPLADWINTLRNLGIARLAANLLESGSLFTTLAAQSLYMGQPLLEPWVPRDRVNQIAAILEEPEAGRQLARLLREEGE
ncbi:MAG: hypothetical protein ACRDFQ_04350 [Anaerolineales bacterium]